MQIAVVCSIYDIRIKNLAEEHQLGLRENPGGRMNVVLSDLSYKERWDQSDDQADFDVFGPNDMENNTNAPINVLKSEGHAHVFCTALPFAILYKTLP